VPIKITVVKTIAPEDVFRGDIPGYIPEESRTACTRHVVGDTFTSQTHECPDGFCNWAYADIQKDISDLHYDSPPYYERWLKGHRVNYISCTNGLAPVIFKIERVHDE
jgi:uncharacterized repeat protein (TIGR04076 family)